MSRASNAQRAMRLNHARELLQRFDHLPDDVAQIRKNYGLSRRQAYRYIQQAAHLKHTLHDRYTKNAFTSKLAQALFLRLRSFSNRTELSLSEIVIRALLAVLPQRKRRG